MAAEMMAADLVISRAGATTLAELAASGRPAVLVPFAKAADDHQRKNARVLEHAGAAVVVEEAALSGQQLAEVIEALVQDRPRLAAMAGAMSRLARPDAAARIVDRLLELAGPAALSAAEPAHADARR